MPNISQVMLAQDYDPSIHDRMFPLYASPKVDGIRAFIDNGVVWARSNKAIPNHHIQELLPLYLPSGVDVELGIGDYKHQTHFSNTTSVVMSDCKPITDLHVYILDYVEPEGHEIRRYAERITYIQRWKKARTAFEDMKLDVLWQRTSILSPVKLSKPSQVPLFLEQCINKGYEGIVLRHPNGGYEFGRPSPKEGLLLRHKPLASSEAIIIGFTELEHNDNEQTTSPTGKATRSTKQAGKRSSGTLGSFCVRDINTGVEFSVGGGTGLTQEVRKTVWSNRSHFLGKIIRYDFLSVGTKHKPRQPKFTGFRDKADL